MRKLTSISFSDWDRSITDFRNRPKSPMQLLSHPEAHGFDGHAQHDADEHRERHLHSRRLPHQPADDGDGAVAEGAEVHQKQGHDVRAKLHLNVGFGYGRHDALGRLRGLEGAPLGQRPERLCFERRQVTAFHRSRAHLRKQRLRRGGGHEHDLGTTRLAAVDRVVPGEETLLLQGPQHVVGRPLADARDAGPRSHSVPEAGSSGTSPARPARTACAVPSAGSPPPPLPKRPNNQLHCMCWPPPASTRGFARTKKPFRSRAPEGFPRWWAERDSNPRPLRCERSALTS